MKYKLQLSAGDASPAAGIQLDVLQELDHALHPDLIRLAGVFVAVVEALQLLPVHHSARFPVIRLCTRLDNNLCIGWIKGVAMVLVTTDQCSKSQLSDLWVCEVVVKCDVELPVVLGEAVDRSLLPSLHRRHKLT